MRIGYPRNVEHVYTLDCLEMGAKRGGFATTVLNKYKGSPKMFDNLDDSLEICQASRKNAHEQVVAVEAKLVQIQESISKLVESREEKRKEMQSIQSQIIQYEVDIQHITEKLRDEEPANISALKDEKQTLEQEIARLGDQESNLQSRQVDLEHERDRLHTCKRTIERSMYDLGIEKEILSHKTDELEKDKESLTNSIYRTGLKLTKLQSEHKDVKREYNKELAVIQKYTEKASASCPRPERIRCQESIEEEILLVKANIKENEAMFGNRQAVYEDLKKKQSVLQDAMNQLGQMNQCIELMEESWKSRMVFWMKCRELFSKKARFCFQEVMRKRGYHGKLNLDHENQTLEMTVF